MQLVTLSGPGQSRAVRILDAQRAATPDMTWRELIEVWPELLRMNSASPVMGWGLSDILSPVMSTVRAGTSAVGLGQIGSGVTDVLSSIGHSLENNIGGQLNDAVKADVADALGLNPGKSIMQVFKNPVVWVVVAVLFWFLFLRRGR